MSYLQTKITIGIQHELLLEKEIPLQRLASTAAEIGLKLFNLCPEGIEAGKTVLLIGVSFSKNSNVTHILKSFAEIEEGIDKALEGTDLVLAPEMRRSQISAISDLEEEWVEYALIRKVPPPQ